MASERSGRPGVAALIVWLVFAAVLLAAGYTLLGACGIRLGGSVLFNFCRLAEPPQASTALASEQARMRRLESELARLQLGIAGVAACPVEARQEAALPPPELELAPEAEAEPETEQVTELTAPPNCPVPTPAELLMVIDTSGSMLFKYDADPALERRAQQLQQQLGSIDPNNIIGVFIGLAQANRIQQELEQTIRQLESGPGPDRMAVAKDASTHIVDALPEVVDMTLVTFGECGRYEHRGPFSASQREGLKQSIRGLRTDGPTPLANVLDVLPQLTGNGRSGDRPVNVVLVSDGQDSCNGDPCAAARRLKRQMPYTVVSVVAASQNIGALRCIADETKGLFLEAASAEDLNVAVRRASGHELAEECQQPR